ncbi:hypothetical protein C0Q70_18011 [Pomacea canaliculata]|uniref:Uncharacterized protein n=1 Tax=Pomacea canaliculata TaxID=400727 RepID=A0A2T7NM12_POMCA|nr:hypothetical protein C0Q70_18011 [Pomacea canaliculata]
MTAARPHESSEGALLCAVTSCAFSPDSLDGNNRRPRRDQTQEQRKGHRAPCQGPALRSCAVDVTPSAAASVIEYEAVVSSVQRWWWVVALVVVQGRQVLADDCVVLTVSRGD